MITHDLFRRWVCLLIAIVFITMLAYGDKKQVSSQKLLFPTVTDSERIRPSPFLAQKITPILPEQKANKSGSVAATALHLVALPIVNQNGGAIYKMLMAHKRSFFSPHGFVLFEPTHNTLLLNDTDSNIARVKRLMNAFNAPIQKVLIEARMVVTDQKALHELGVTISGFSNGGASGSGVGVAGSVKAAILNPVGVLGMSIGQLPLGFMLDLELQALESEGDSEVISSPEVMVDNGHKARIEQGKEVPYNTETASGSTQVQYKKAVLGLHVTPRVKANNNIALRIEVNNDAISQHLGQAGAIPIIDTTSLSTDVLVKNGQTVVLGGIYLTLKQDSTRQVPFLGGLPLIGHFFRSDRHKNQRAELLIFIRPVIIR